jgi:hypothetical protein
MIKINIANPEFPELSEYNRIMGYLKGQYPELSVSVVRSGDNYAMSKVSVSRVRETHVLAEGFAIYPHSPNAAIGQLKADIIAITRCMKELGIEFEYIDFHVSRPEQVHVTRSKMNSCVSVRQLVSVLEDANHEKLPEVLAFVESKRAKGGRPSKKSIIDMVFSSQEVDKRSSPLRTGIEWANVKRLWTDKFQSSKFVKQYKSLDEFCTFATEEEVSQ